VKIETNINRKRKKKKTQFENYGLTLNA